METRTLPLLVARGEAEDIIQYGIQQLLPNKNAKFIERGENPIICDYCERLPPPKKYENKE